MANTIGIDFGTTKTMVSYFNPATGLVDLVSLGRCGRASIPTTVHVDEFGAFLFGDDADDQIEMDPEGYCRAFKLHLGEEDPVLFRADETAESLAAHFLRHVKEECEQSVPVFHGEPVTSATITIPVAFSPARKASLKRAAEAAGFSSVSFLPEPEAAGTAFLRDNPADKFSRALVLDWGGGTLDIAIISRDEDGSIHADHHCVEGRDDMGGEEMDRGLFENLKIMWENTYGSPLLESEENEPKLLRKSEQVKIALSNKEVVPFYLRRKKIDVTRDKFRRIVEELLQVSVELVQSALSKNKAQGRPEPDAIILIGGMSQSPVVREAMERNFPKLRVLSWHRSHEAVALGATRVPAVGKMTKENSTELRVQSRHPSNKSVPLDVIKPVGLGAIDIAQPTHNNQPPKVLKKYSREEVGRRSGEEDDARRRRVVDIISEQHQPPKVLKKYSREEVGRRSGAEDDARWRRVVDIISEQLGVDARQIGYNSNIIYDLGADSLDTGELIMAFEEEFGAAIPEEDANRLMTPGAICQYLKAHGY